MVWRLMRLKLVGKEGSRGSDLRKHRDDDELGR